MPYAHIPDWLDKLKARLYAQFRDLPNLGAVVAAIAAKTQEIEDAIRDCYTITSIGESVGAQLDNLGRLVAEPRDGKTDVVYRLYIRAKIRAHRSSGTYADLYAVLTALFLDLLEASITPAPPAGITVTVTAPPLSQAEADAVLHFMIEAKAAGVRLFLEWQDGDTGDLFTFQGGEGLGFGDYYDANAGGRFVGFTS